ncbi:hypothetical protein [Undibacterium fentianense]|uniref:Carboxypeptidase regulatory-like domain-containing protein n=1 Tax=Undibacterium fentianense TaxID=2828728 RepID=A0A941IGK0_9BURK|nr:hypothetical protein [Undibacterium fentianense]MBR7800085.1 hypothetical protein [Undibacterium fentianense]
MIRQFSGFVFTALFCTSLAASPGTPIGGIIVKGGKNPGGQMIQRALTDSNGQFQIEFSEGGEYRLSFETGDSKVEARNSFGEKLNAGLALDYTVVSKSTAGRHTPFHNKVTNGMMLVTVPEGGGSMRGVLSSGDATSATASPSLDRAINESGISVKSEPKKGVKK